VAALRIVIRGRVQGVGFRYYVVQQARALGVCGEVWNREDGAVELHAEHPNAAVLASLVQAMNEGPGDPRKIESSSLSDQGSTEFRVGPTRP